METAKGRASVDSTGRPPRALSARSVARARTAALEPILQSVSDGVVVVDPDGVFILFNHAAERILGVGLLDVSPERWTETYGLFLPDRVTPFPAERLPLVCAIHGEHVREVEIFVRNPLLPEGAVISVNATPWRDPSGVLLGGIAVFRDITAHKNADATVRRLSNAVEQTADAIYITSRDGIIEYVNPGFEVITGYSREEALGRTPRLLRSGQHDAEHYRGLWGALLAGEVFRGTMVNRRKNGEIYYAEMTITPIKDTTGAVTHFVAVGKDMTDRRKRQEREMELGIARAVQAELFPTRAPHLAGFDLAGAAHPATEMCGDYFDFIRVENGRLGLVVGDVSGHGLGPALVMAEARAYLRAYLRTLADASTVLRAVNETLVADLEDGRFVSMLLAVLDLDARSLSYANAGHPPGYVLGADGGVKAVLESTGTPLGLYPDCHVSTTRSVPLADGDAVILLTDGITESQAPDGSFLGADGALRIVRGLLHGSAQQVLDGLVAGVREFTGGCAPVDDVTAIVCKARSRD